jgi:cholesterol transport system auxiliary component
MKTPSLFLVAFLLAGCASRGAPPIDTYDFGIAGATSAPAEQDVFLADVRAADWLNTTNMLYRLEYRNPLVLSTYSASRWAGTPAAMLTLRMRQSVGNGASTRGRQTKCTLSLFLSEFSQVFANDRDSRAVMHVRATLTPVAAGEPVLVREFRIERTAPTPNAAGEAAAFADVATALSEKLNGWIGEAGICKN